MKRSILHVDMDEFFAAVEKLDHPEFVGKPLLVAGSPQSRGVVCTASYEARKFGCHAAMPTSQALRLCPDAIVVPPGNPRYSEISKQVFDVFYQFTPSIEPLSCDEAFLDITGTEKLFGSPIEVAKTIKLAVKTQVGIVASVGVASNKFLAKLASDLEKPDGLTVIPDDKIQRILDPLPIRKLWGVGKTTEKKLLSRGITTIGKLRRFPRDLLVPLLGNATDHFLALSKGEDYRQVTPAEAAKSIGQENTFAKDIDTLDELRKILHAQSSQVARRLRKHNFVARTITIKLKNTSFQTYTRSMSLPEPTNSSKLIFDTAKLLLDKWARTDFSILRLIGVTASGLRQPGGHQLGLFDIQENEKQKKLDSALDKIVSKFGPTSIQSADQQ